VQTNFKLFPRVYRVATCYYLQGAFDGVGPARITSVSHREAYFSELSMIVPITCTCIPKRDVIRMCFLRVSTLALNLKQVGYIKGALCICELGKPTVNVMPRGGLAITSFHEWSIAEHATGATNSLTILCGWSFEFIGTDPDASNLRFTGKY